MKRYITLLMKSFYFFINVFVAVLLLFVKKNKDEIVIGSWDGLRYADNSRFLFEFLSKNTDYKVYWATKSDCIMKELTSYGFNCIKIGSWNSFKVHIKSKYHIVCTSPGDISGELSWGAIKINLWHGMPIKCVSNLANDSGYKDITFFHKSTLFKKLKRISLFNAGGWNDCLYLSPGAPGDEAFISDFKIDSNRIINANYPRNYNSLFLFPYEKKVIEMMSKYSTTILYLPTFRENNQNDELLDPIQNDSFRRFVESHNCLWIDKKHFASSCKNEAESQKDNSYVIHLDSSFDVNLIVGFADIVITDYSSVYYDALYFMKKIILYMPDYSYYKTNDRGFFRDPAQLPCCMKAYDINEFYDCIKKTVDKNLYFNENEIRKERSKCWSFSEESLFSVSNILFNSL